MASLLGDGVRLTLVLSDALVDLSDDIEPDGGGQDGREGEGRGGLCTSSTMSSCSSLKSETISMHSPPEAERTLTVGREAIVAALVLSFEVLRISSLFVSHTPCRRRSPEK